MTVDVIGSVVQRIREVRNADKSRDWTPPEGPPEYARDDGRPALEWRPTDYVPGAAISLSDARRKVVERLTDHLTGPEDGRILIVRAPAGLGKTWAGVQVAQDLALRGVRVGYFAPYRDFWANIQAMPHFRPDLWMEWLPIHLNTGPEDRIPTTCRYAPAMHEWLDRGYDGMDLCRQLCMWDGHLSSCPYRCQAKQFKPPRRILFGMHQHLAFGLGAGVDVAIVDENPMAAFVYRRAIAKDRITVPGAVGPLAELLEALEYMAGLWYQVSGPYLMERIGPILVDVYAQVETVGLPLVPEVTHPDQVNEMPYFYVGHLLETLSPEFEAWRAGWEEWARRVYVGKGRLEIWDRHQVRLQARRWAILDATARLGVYARLFNRDEDDLDVYEPRVKRKGRIVQIVGRLNGSGSLFDARGRPTAMGRNLVDQVEVVARAHPGRRVAAVTFKNLVDAMTEIVGPGNVAHFGAMRGSNVLEGCDVLVVAGSYCPPPQDLARVAAAIMRDRVHPFLRPVEREDGTRTWVAPWGRCWVEYPLAPDNPQRKAHGDMTPWREVSGYWFDPDLLAVWEQLSIAEIVQALNRARIVHRPAVVYVLSPLPVGEVDEVRVGLAQALGIPTNIPAKYMGRILDLLDAHHERGEPVTNDDLARVTGTDPGWVRRRYWLDALAHAMPDRWRLDAIRTGKRGRPTKVLVPIEEIEETEPDPGAV